MAGLILVTCTAGLAALGVWLLYSANPDTEWCEHCDRPLWYHSDLWCDEDHAS